MEIIMSGKYTLKMDKDRIAEARDRRIKYYNKQNVDRLPFQYFSGTSDCPNYTYGDIIRDVDKLIEQKIAQINAQTESFPDTDFLPYLNPVHLGEGMVPSMFGAEQYVVEDNPPYTKGRVMRNIYDLDKLPRKINPETDGWGPKLKEMCEKFLDAVQGEVPVVVSDHQSPYGVATKICDNEELMLAMYDEPEMVHEFFDIVTAGIADTIDAMEKWCGIDCLAKNEALPVPGNHGLILWDDYISVVTPSLHKEFCAPYNMRLYEKYGAGHLHTCGPYFPRYIDACINCKPKSMDLAIMRGMSRSKEDMIEFRRITKEAGVMIIGSPDFTSEHIFNNNWGTKDDEYLHYMADGGIMYSEWGAKENGEARTKHWHDLTRDLVNVW